MGNHTGNISLHTFVFNKNTVILASQIADIFDIDGDFGENDECFREDTIKKGFASESQRCAEMVFEMHKDIKDPKEQLEAILNSVINQSFKNSEYTTEFILESSYCSGYETKILESGNHLILSIAYTS